MKTMGFSSITVWQDEGECKISVCTISNEVTIEMSPDELVIFLNECSQVVAEGRKVEVEHQSLKDLEKERRR